MTTIHCDKCAKSYKSELACKACGALMTMQPTSVDLAGPPDWILFHCDNCGKKYKAKSVCQFCGGPVTVEAASEAVSEFTPSEPEPAPEPFPEFTPSAPEPEYEQLVLDDDGGAVSSGRKSGSSSKKIPILAGVGILVVLAVIAVVIFGLPFGAKEPAMTPTAKTTPSPGQAKKPAAVQKPTGELVVAVSSLHQETFLPWMGGTLTMMYISPINEYLVYRDPANDAAKPGLATRWQMAPDGKQWTFWLREGVPFHEGWGELTSEDVKYTFERIVGKDSNASSSSEVRNLIDSIETPEKYKVIFKLKKPSLGFPLSIAGDGGQQGIVCKKYLEQVGDKEANAHPIGTGPYTLTDFQVRTHIKLTVIPEVEKHWRVVPAFERITFLRVPDEAERVAMLKSGQADLAPISYDSVAEVRSAGMHIVSIPYNWVPVVRMGGLITTDPKRYNPKVPWADKRVRQALNYAVDKESIADILFSGQAQPAASDLPFVEWFGIDPYPYDPGRARKLLAEAGYPNGFKVTLKTFKTLPGAELPMVGESVAMYWKEIGIDVKIVPTDWGTVRADWTGGKATDFMWTHRGMAMNQISALMATFTDRSPFASYVTPETMKRYDEIQSELDIKKRSKMVEDFGEYIREEAPYLFVVYANEPYGASKKVGSWPTIRMRPQNFELIRRP